MLTESDVWKSNGIMAANCEAELEMSVLMKVVRAVEAEVRAEAQEPCQTAPSFGCIMRERDALQAKVAEFEEELRSEEIACIDQGNTISELRSKISEQAALIEKCEKAFEYLAEIPQNKFVWKGSSESNEGVRRAINEYMPELAEALSSITLHQKENLS